MTKGRKRKGAARSDSQEALGKYVPQFTKKRKVNGEPEDSEQSEDTTITDDAMKAEASADVMKEDGLKSNDNGTTNEINNTNSNFDHTPDTVTSHSNKDSSVDDEKESSEVTGDVSQKLLGQDTAVIVSGFETVEQLLTTVKSNESKPVEIVNETIAADPKDYTNVNSTLPALKNTTVMIVEVAADPAVEQQEEVVTFNESTRKFIDVGIQVDLPIKDSSVHLDGNKATSDPTVTALLDELSSLNRLIMASKRELEAAKRKRDLWVKNNKIVK